VKWLLRDRYDSVAHLASDRPAGGGRHRRHDRIVPPRFGRALYESLAEPRQLSIIEGAGHNDWFDRVDDAWWRTGDRLPAQPAVRATPHQARLRWLDGAG
jgi:hypothetical protein